MPARLLTVLFCLIYSPAVAETWPQWRGPTRDGRVPAGQVWPETLAQENLHPLWTAKLGPSYSGPIVLGDRVFVTATVDRETEVVSALDRKTGAELWSVRWPGALDVPFFAKSNGSWIRSTPAADEESLYVGGIRDVLVCLDVRTGSERWRVDLAKQFDAPLPTFGCVSSPLLVGETVVIQGGAGCVALDRKTGAVRWRSLVDEGGMNGSAFSSPLLSRIGDREQLLVQSRTKLAGLEPSTGKELWTREIPAFRGMNILTPVVDEGRIFTSSYGGASFLFDVAAEDSTWTVKELWKSRLEGYMSTPVLIDGHAYLHLKNQRFACIELATGQDKWITRPYGKYWSLVANGKRILALDETGTLRLIEASPEKFQLLGEVTIDEQPAWAHLAVCGNELFIRTLKELKVFRWE